MTHDRFIEKWNSRYLEFPGTGSAYYQCLDLMRQYIKDVWGLDPYVIPRSVNAASAWYNAKTNSKILKIPNTPNGVPQKGDLIFFEYHPFLYGTDGHVAVVDSADLYIVKSFDQNYPKGKPCQIVQHGKNRILHGYRGCLGWIRKR